MRGTILHFSIQKNQGQIAGNDGKRYQFSGADWNLSNPPSQGTPVDFDVEGNQAVSIYEDPTSPKYLKTPKSRRWAAGLAILGGGLGFQFFYLEAWGWGLVCILFYWTCIPLLIGLIFGIRWYSISDKEFHLKIKNMKGAFPEVEF
jgi:TM2 domain-containing membrane protein YozV